MIVAQTLYSSTKDHINEFATLRAMGSSRGYIYKVIIWQAILSAVIGFCLAALVGAVVVRATAASGSAHCDHARAVGRAVRADRRDVHHLGHRCDHEGDAHRPRTGVHAMSEVVMEAVNVVKVLGSGPAQIRALKGVSLSLRGGELTLLMGPSGSGKTTLLSILGCMLTPTEGTVRVRGDSDRRRRTRRSLAKLRRENMGFVFQSYHLFPTLSATDNVRLALDVRAREAAATPKRQGEEALARVGLAQKTANVSARAQSGGEQQRVAIARAVVGETVGDPRRRADRARSTARTARRSWASSPASPRTPSAACWSSPTIRASCPYADRIVHIEDGNIVNEEVRNNSRSPQEKC